MNWSTRVRLFCLVLALSQAINSAAVVASSPYHAIADRNVFNLQPTSPVIAPSQLPPPPKVRPQVFITGITDVCGRRQALIEMTAPGKPPTKAILAEGERVGPLEVVQIDIRQSQVKVNINGEEGVLMLRAPPSSPSPPTGRLPVAPPAPLLSVRR